jgi:hypothetical protein
MFSGRVTVVIATRNEANRLPMALANFADRFPILVSDNHSTDDTLRIAAAAGVPAITIEHPGYYENDPVMALLWSTVSTDYLMVVGCAEFYPLQLLKRLAEIANTDSHDVVFIKRYSVTYGMAIPLATSPERRNRGELRMHRRGCVSFVGTVIHGVGGAALVPKERQCELGQECETAIIQFRDYDSAHNETQNTRYNNIWAQQRYEHGERFEWMRATLMSLRKFTATYAIHGAWRYGLPGFILAMQRFIMEFQVQCRLWEIEHGLLKSSLERKHAELRTQALVTGEEFSADTRVSRQLAHMERSSRFDLTALVALGALLTFIPFWHLAPAHWSLLIGSALLLGVGLHRLRGMGRHFFEIPWYGFGFLAVFFGVAAVAASGTDVVFTHNVVIALAVVLWLGPVLNQVPARFFSSLSTALVAIALLGPFRAYACLGASFCLGLAWSACSLPNASRASRSVLVILLSGLAMFFTSALLPFVGWQVIPLALTTTGIAAYFRLDAAVGGMTSGLLALAWLAGSSGGGCVFAGILCALLNGGFVRPASVK